MNSFDGMMIADALTTKEEKQFFAISPDISLKNFR
jgi:hypothetical protein